MRFPPADCHTHPQGRRLQSYRPSLLNDWADTARQLGLCALTFTDSAHQAAGLQFDLVDQLNDDRLFVGCGLELDNRPGNAAACETIAMLWDRLDVVVGIVNHLGNWCFTRRDTADEFQKRDPDRLYAAYYHEMRLLIAGGLIDCIAQFDLIKMYGIRPATSFFADVSELLCVMKDSGLSLMICASGWGHTLREPYPSAEIVREALRLQIPITLGSDAYAFNQLAANYEYLRMYLEELGVRSVGVHRRHRIDTISL